MTRLRAFGRFWAEFVIGDDWRIAAGLAGAFVLGWAVVRSGTPAWWIVPLAVALLLGLSLRRAARAPGSDS